MDDYLDEPQKDWLLADAGPSERLKRLRESAKALGIEESVSPYTDAALSQSPFAVTAAQKATQLTGFEYGGQQSREATRPRLSFDTAEELFQKSGESIFGPQYKVPEKPKPFQPDPNDPSSYRVDGTLKGPGFLGSLQTRAGQTATEKSIGVEIDGRKVLIPAIVPGLTKEELSVILSDYQPDTWPKSIIEKAVTHAKSRMQQGKSPFMEAEELPKPTFLQQAGEVGAGALNTAIGVGEFLTSPRGLTEIGTSMLFPPAGLAFLGAEIAPGIPHIADLVKKAAKGEATPRELGELYATGAMFGIPGAHALKGKMIAGEPGAKLTPFDKAKFVRQAQEEPMFITREPGMEIPGRPQTRAEELQKQAQQRIDWLDREENPPAPITSIDPKTGRPVFGSPDLISRKLSPVEEVERDYLRNNINDPVKLARFMGHELIPEGGEKGAAKEGEITTDDAGKLPRISPREDLRTDDEKVREGEGEPAGGGGGAGAKAQVAVGDYLEVPSGAGQGTLRVDSIGENHTTLTNIDTGNQRVIRNTDLNKAVDSGEVIWRKTAPAEKAVPAEEAVVPTEAEVPGLVEQWKAKADAARPIIHENLFGTTNIAYDPLKLAKVLDAWADIGAYHIVKTGRDFGMWSKAFLAEVGDKYRDQVKPYLREIYDRALGQLDSQRKEALASAKEREDIGSVGAVREAIKGKEMALSATEDEFFTKIWPKMLRSTGLTTKNYPEAARQAVIDLSAWIKENPRFQDYYEADFAKTREIIEKGFGKKLTDPQFRLFRLLNGLFSTATPLEFNTRESINALKHYLREGNLDAVRSITEPSVDKNGKPITVTRAHPENPFAITGGAPGVKARTIEGINRLLKRFGGDINRTIDFLEEPVTRAELKKFNNEMGYKGEVGEITGIVRDVESATGQGELIPRIFAFGKKVGNYTLNNLGDSRYHTVDVWESRFIKSYFKGLLEKNPGIAESASEHEIISKFENAFLKRWKELVDPNAKASGIQAARWYYILDSVRKAGYSRAVTDDVISYYTQKHFNKGEPLYAPGGKFDLARGGLGDAGRSQGVLQKVKEKIRADIQKTEARRAARREGRLYSVPLDPRELANFIDDARIGAGYLSEGIIDRIQWGKAMIERLGERIRPMLDDLWEHAQKMYDKYRAAEEARPQQAEAGPEPAEPTALKKFQVSPAELTKIHREIDKLTGRTNLTPQQEARLAELNDTIDRIGRPLKVEPGQEPAGVYHLQKFEPRTRGQKESWAVMQGATSWDRPVRGYEEHFATREVAEKRLKELNDRVTAGDKTRDELMRRYALVGAEMIDKGHKDIGSFMQAMVREFHSGIADLIPEIFERSKNIYQKMREVAGPSGVRAEIERAVKLRRAREAPILVGPVGAMKAMLRAAERAGKAGYKRGSAEVAELRRQLRTAERTGTRDEVRGLRDRLRAAERAGKAGFRRGYAEAAMAGNEKLRDVMDTLRTAERWLSADIDSVKERLMDFAKYLSPGERSKYINRITNALRQPSAFTRDPGVIKRRAEVVLNQMTESIYREHRKESIADIKKVLQKVEDSKTIRVEQKQAIRQMGVTFNNLKDRMSLNMLQAMRDRMEEAKELGHDLWLMDKTMQEARTAATLQNVAAQTTTRAYNMPQRIWAEIGEELTKRQVLANQLRETKGLADGMTFALTPMDWVIERFDGKPNGAIWENLKAPIDVRFGEFLDKTEAYKKRLRDVLMKHPLSAKELEGVGAHAELRQEGGEKNLRATLAAKGFSEASIDKQVNKYSNLGNLNADQRAYLKEADKILREMFPMIKDVLAKDFNEEITWVDKYFPRLRDWNWYNEESIREGRFANAFRQRHTQAGATITRQPGAVTKNELNAHNVMMNHIEDMMYHITMGPEINRASRVIEHPEFKAIVGTRGHQIFSDWVDVLARNGGVDASRRWAWLDTIRKNVGLAQLSWRITTTALQPWSLIQGYTLVRSESMSRAIGSMTWGADAKLNRQWILDNFPEVKARVGDDPAYNDYKGAGFRDRWAQKGFKYISTLDRFAAMTVAEGAYRHYLEDKGIPFDRNVVNQDAVQYAQGVVRKTQASAMPKDMPLALSRGNFSGNRSVDRAVFQFQTFIINRWSQLKNIRGQLESGDIRGASRVLTFLALSTIVENILRDGISQAIRYTLGVSRREESRLKGLEADRNWATRIALRSGTDFLMSTPVVSNYFGRVRYHSSFLPVMDTLADAADASAIIWAEATSGLTNRKFDPLHLAKGVVRTAQAVGGAAGIPTGQAGDLVMSVLGRLEPRAGGHAPAQRPVYAPGAEPGGRRGRAPGAAPAGRGGRAPGAAPASRRGRAPGS